MKKKLSPITILHLALMVAMIITTLISVIVILTRGKLGDFATYFGSLNYGVILIGIVNIAALVCGAIYTLKGYSKQAAGYYKAFIALLAVYICITMFTDIQEQEILHLILKVAKIVLLFTLAFGKDLGKRNTWILFGLLMAIDICLPFISANGEKLKIYSYIAILSSLLMDGTIGLAIRGKYEDKDKRGTK